MVYKIMQRTEDCLKIQILYTCTDHCESGEGLWLQGEAALQMHIFRDTDPQPVIPQNKN